MSLSHDIRFGRLTEVAIADIVAHMSDPRLREHMPLLKGPWGETEARAFVAAKEACWARALATRFNARERPFLNSV